jgi:hypothetical protein
MTDRIPMGWFDLVHDLRMDLHRAHPSAAVTAMTADRGWLHVAVDDSQLGPAEQAACGRLVQGYVTQSLSTCMACGSAYGRDRGERRVVTCDGCEEETWCDAS